jgi:hypothetical protein|tara:strand:+ start:648 stop:848 length:201 start_codon:yes stop_codon:yes gene_type:complete
MIRVPAKLRGNSAEASWHNQIREVILSLMPVQSVNNKISRTTKGTIIEGTAAGSSSGGGSGKAVWL